MSITYRDKPIFLHHVNRELHESLKKSLFTTEIIREIRYCSILFSQQMFCNVSQIFEFAENSSETQEELRFLIAADRFCAHSDYYTIEEFVESRREIYRHDKERYSYYFDNNSLPNISLGSLGRETSTTKFIEKGLLRTINDNSNMGYGGILRENDFSEIKRSENKILKTLKDREDLALTFPTFRKISMSNSSPKTEGAVRRALTSFYVEHYVQNYGALTIWGNRYLSYFDYSPFYSGLNISFMKYVLEDTLISTFLRQHQFFGIHHRIACEGSEIAISFREQYAKLAVEMDRISPNTANALLQSRFVEKTIETMRNSQSIRPNIIPSNLDDIMHIAVEKFEHITGKLKNSEDFSGNLEALQTKNYTQRIYSKSEVPVNPTDSILAIDGVAEFNTPTKTQSDSLEENWWKIACLVGVIFIPVVYYGIDYFFEATRSERGLASLLISPVLIFLISWFNPQFIYLRLGFICMGLVGLSGFGVKFDFSGNGNAFGGYFQTGGSASSAYMIVIGCLAALLFILDYRSRKMNR